MTSSATKGSTVTTTHTAFVGAPPRAVYHLIAEAHRWPYLFGPVLHVQRQAAGTAEDQLRLWTVSNGAVRSWTSRRSLDCDGLRIRFRQENPAPPVAAISGEWVFVPLPGNATSVVLLHEFRAIGDRPGNTALIKQAVDRNSTAELAALKSAAELGDRLATVVLSVAETVLVEATLGPVYDFLYRAQDWPARLPHVSRVVLDEAVPNVQTVEMDAGGPDGGTETTRLVRVCFPYHSIVYKQTEPPELLSAHVGRWQLRPSADGVRVTAQNTVMIRPDRARQTLRQHGTLEPIGELVRDSLRRNCLAILRQAKHSAEGRPTATPG